MPAAGGRRGRRRFLAGSTVSRTGRGFLSEQMKELLLIAHDDRAADCEGDIQNYSCSRTGLRTTLLTG